MRVDRMFKIAALDPGNEAQVRSVFQQIDQNFDDLFRAIARIALGEPADGDKLINMDAAFVKLTTNAVANTDDTIQHKLTRVPVGLINVELPNTTPNTGRVYFGSVLPTSTQVTLRCTTASKAACVILF